MRRREPIPGDLLLSVLVSLLASLLIVRSRFADPTVEALSLTVLTFLLFGYAVTTALFPKKGVVSVHERVATGLVSGLIIASVAALLMMFTSPGIELMHVALALTLLTIILAALAHQRRLELPRNRRFSPFSARGPSGGGSLRSVKNRWTVPRARKLAPSVALVLLMMVAVYAIATVVTTPGGKDGSTDFYVLGDIDGYYPTSVVAGKVCTVTVGLVNREGRPANYTLQLVTENESLFKRYIRLEDNQTWENPVSYILRDVGDLQSLEFLLFLEDELSTPYRDHRMLVDVSKPEKATLPADNVSEMPEDVIEGSTSEGSSSQAESQETYVRPTSFSLGSGGSGDGTSAKGSSVSSPKTSSKSQTSSVVVQPSSRPEEDEAVESPVSEEESISAEKELKITGVPETESFARNADFDISTGPSTEDGNGEYASVEAESPQDLHVSKENVWTLPLTSGRDSPGGAAPAVEAPPPSGAGPGDDSIAGGSGEDGSPGGLDDGTANAGAQEDSETPSGEDGSPGGLDGGTTNAGAQEDSETPSGEGSETVDSKGDEDAGAKEGPEESSWLKSSKIDEEIDRMMSKKDDSTQETGKIETDNIKVTGEGDGDFAVLGSRSIAPVKVGR